jgi:hypothetical protein
MNGFDYIKRHFGYRLFIKSISVSYEKYGAYTMKIKLGNAGFGNLFKTKKIDIIFTDMNDKLIKRKNVGKYTGSLDVSISGNFLAQGESSEYKVYLSVYSSIESNVVYYPIQFANVNIYNKNLKGHYLFTVKNGQINGKSQSGGNGSTDTNNISTDGKCGKLNSKTCPKGQCCSTFGYCGTDDDFCIKYCDPKYGECRSAKLEVSTDGNCGKINGKACPKGQCCSTFGYCGTDDDYCIKYCEPKYGECRTKALEISTDGNCGKLNGKACPKGECCSTFGYCGKSDDFCIKYCDPKYTQCKK